MVASAQYAALRRRASLAVGSAILGTALTAWGLGAVVGITGAPLLGFVAKAVLVPVVLAFAALPSLVHHRWPTLGAANGVTLFRSVLVGATAAFLGEPSAEAMVWPLFFASGAAFVLDWLDGRLARASGRASPFGARLDMELDAITVLVLCGLVWHLDRAGLWVFLAGALRYVFVAAAAIWPWMTRELYPTNRRRFVCGVQVTCLIWALVPWPVPGLAAAIAAFGLLALVGSFALDTRWLWVHRAEPGLER
ncbi:MAG: CDP-alcohol phosphatidyltransferase family protein [Myxococcota bacterium]